MKHIGAVIFHPPEGTSEGELLVSRARTAAMVDLAERLGPFVSTLVLVGDPPRLDAPKPWSRVHAPRDGAFHLGDTLKEIIRTHRLDALLYFGSGSGTLLSERAINRLVRFAQRDDVGALFNNFYSCDFAAFSDTEPLLRLPLPAGDNGLGLLLSDAGMACYGLQRSLETQFDLDTPTDVLLLKESGRGGGRLRAFLDSLPVQHPTLAKVADVLVERSALVYLIGRVSPVVWQAFETQVACRTAGLIEGRGMKAYVHPRTPLLTTVFRDLGVEDLFARLEATADAAIIDSRPLLARGGALPPTHERFSSDLFRVGDLQDPQWIDFTRAAQTCGIPVLLGGHSLVSGGLYLLSEICWKGRNLPRRLHPEPYEGDGIPHESISGETHP